MLAADGPSIDDNITVRMPTEHIFFLGQFVLLSFLRPARDLQKGHESDQLDGGDFRRKTSSVILILAEPCVKHPRFLGLDLTPV